MTSNGLSNQTVGVAADIGVEKIANLRGRRIPYVRGAPIERLHGHILPMVT